MINNINTKIINNLYRQNLCKKVKLQSFKGSYLKPLEKDTVSFKASAFKRDSMYRCYQEKPFSKDNSYRIIYYEDVTEKMEKERQLPYPPSHIEFKNPEEILKSIDIIEYYLYNCSICNMKDINQVKILKEFISNEPAFKKEKVKSLLDAFSTTLVIELEDNRVLKMTKYNPFPQGRQFESSFDIPLLSEVYNYKGYYFYIQEKANTDDVDMEKIENVAERIVRAGYKPYDLEGNTLQIGWSEMMQDYMLIDSECAQVI